MTDNRKRVDVTVFRVERGTNSHFGNPRFKLHTSVGVYETETDGSISYSIDNYCNSRHPETYIIDQEVTLVLTSGGKVTDIEKNGKRLR